MTACSETCKHEEVVGTIAHCNRLIERDVVILTKVGTGKKVQFLEKEYTGSIVVITPMTATTETQSMMQRRISLGRS